MARLFKSEIIKYILIPISCLLSFGALAQFSQPKDSFSLDILSKSSAKQLILGTDNQLMLDYDVKKLPFFCKIEAEGWKDQKLPAYFRLGSMDEVNRLEGKQVFKTYTD